MMPIPRATVITAYQTGGARQTLTGPALQSVLAPVRNGYGHHPLLSYDVYAPSGPPEVGFSASLMAIHHPLGGMTTNNCSIPTAWLTFAPGVLVRQIPVAIISNSRSSDFVVSIALSQPMGAGLGQNSVMTLDVRR